MTFINETLRIRVQHTSNASGRSQWVAKGGGKQRTVSTDLERSDEWNAGNVAGELALAHGLKWHDGITHEDLGDNVHYFYI